MGLTLGVGSLTQPGQIIYAESGHRCLTVAADGIHIESQDNCEQIPVLPTRQFSYDSGHIVNANGKCLDAGDMANGTQLALTTCNGAAPSQQWQIK